MIKKYKILLSAYACELNKGSEPEVGWMWALTLSQLGHEVYVVTRLNNKKNIEELTRNIKFKNLHFHYFDYPNWVVKFIKGKHNPRSYFYFFIWQIGIFFSTKSLIKKIKFDFIQHVTFVSLRFPSFLCFNKIPFIFGPVSGGDIVPYQLMKSFSIYNKLQNLLRNFSNKYIKISPLMNMTFFNSKKILVNNLNTKELIPNKYHYKVEQMLAIGKETFCNNEIDLNKDHNVFNICYAGNLNEEKGLGIVLKTFARLHSKNKSIKLTIIGSGKDEVKFKKVAVKYKINNNLNWLGKIEQNKVLKIFKNSDLLLFPSLRDSGGFVVLEALSQSLPVATLNIGGPGLMIDNDCGIKINVNKKNENEIIYELSTKINELIDNDSLIIYKRKKSLEKVNNFTWKIKAQKLYN